MAKEVTPIMCRICVKEPPGGSVKHMQNIFREKSKFVEQIYECSGVKLKPNGKLPGRICRKCSTLLKYAVKFRTTCRKSQDYFRTFLNESPARGRPSSSLSIEAQDCITSEEGSTKYPIKGPEDCINFVEIKDDLNAFSDHSPDVIPEESPLSQAMPTDEIGGTVTDQEAVSEVMPKEDSDREFTAEEKIPAVDPEELKEPDERLKGAVPEVADRKSEFKTRRKRGLTDGPKVFICEQCGNNFTCRHHFVTHLRRHTGDKRFHCEVCPNKFFTNTELNRHMRRHTGERPFACKHCNRRFTDYSTRIKHERTHTNERPFACPQCTKAFTTSYILKNHMLIHTGERSFTCQLCSKSFQRQSHLVVHFRSIMHKQNADKTQRLPKELANMSNG